MEHVLLVSSGEAVGKSLLQLLRESCPDITVAQSGGEARRMLLLCDYSLAVINTPLSDEFGHELAVSITQKSYAGVLLLVKSEMADSVSQKVEDAGVFVVPKPIGRQMFFQSIKLIEASRRRLLGLKQENIKLHQKVDEIRLVNRAKCVLIQYLGMTETQAHRYIEKQAMDMRLTRKEIALSILKTYEQ